ncbi:MAG: hotdog fold thioesterase [Rhizobiaceae bacterium]|nr:hotdog fold thioesterase [Rhizobiaceae bacterium]
MNPEIENKIRASFDAQSMMTSIGAELKTVQSGNVVITSPVLEGFRQQQDFAHGGLIFTLGDSAAGYAALSVMPLDMEVMTVELKINIMAPAPASGMLIAQGKVLKPGRRLVIVASEVWCEDTDGHRVQVAALQGTMIPVNP